MDINTFFNQAEIKEFHSTDATIAYRKYGNGPPVLFIHGFPVHGYTWRKILPELSKKHTCYVVDLPGLGLSQWTEKTNFHFEAHSDRLVQFLKSADINSCSIIAHNTGATTARLMALSKEIEVPTLILLNTEVPNHRPPWIELYQKASQLPLSHHFFKLSLKNKYFVRSGMGLKAFYTDKRLLKEEENIAPYIDLVTSTTKSMKGALSYLRGCDLKFMDTLKEKQKLIKSRVVLIWGEDDVTFPVEYGEKLASQFKAAEFYRIPNASLMPHEEKPKEVLEIIASKLS